jgi:hypothetical protein
MRRFMSLGVRRCLQQFRIIRKHLERFVVARRFEQGQDPPQHRIYNRRCVLHIKVNGLEPISKMEFGVIV